MSLDGKVCLLPFVTVGPVGQSRILFPKRSNLPNRLILGLSIASFGPYYMLCVISYYINPGSPSEILDSSKLFHSSITALYSQSRISL